MRKLAAIVSAIAVSGLTLTAGVTPAAAWYHHGWHHRGYYPYYYNNNNDAFAAGIFGLAAGAMIGAAAANANGESERAHILACERHYRSYDVRTDTYLGYDDYRHRCLY